MKPSTHIGFALEHKDGLYNLIIVFVQSVIVKTFIFILTAIHFCTISPRSQQRTTDGKKPRHYQQEKQ